MPTTLTCGVVVGSPHRGLHVGLRGEVEDDVGARRASMPSRMSRSTNVAAGVDVLALAEGEVVDDDDVVAARDERVDEVRADEAGASGDDRAHDAVS